MVVVEKCLAFCQGLVESNKFTFNLSLAEDAFIFDNKELATNSSCEKKKESPSQLRREKKWKEERKMKKRDTAKVSENLDPESP